MMKNLMGACAALVGIASVTMGAATPAEAQWYGPVLRYGPSVVQWSYNGGPVRAYDAVRTYGPPALGWAGGPLRYQTTPAYMYQGRPVYSNGPTIRYR